MPSRSLPLCLAFGLAVPCAAQHASVTVTTCTDCSTSATINGVSTTGLLPTGTAGPNAVSGAGLTAGGGSAAANISWCAVAWDTELFVELTMGLGIDTALPASVAAGPNEFLVEFAADAFAPSNLQIERSSALSVGAPLPLVQIDFGNDGTIDVANVPATGLVQALPRFGAKTCRLRVVLGASLTGAGYSSTALTLRVLPENDLLIAKSVVGCSAHAGEFHVTPVFPDRGVFLSLPFVGLTSPTFAVFGLNLQPQFLPPTSLGPCLLLSAADIVAWLPALGWLEMPLPPDMRPISFWTQGLVFEPMGLELTDGYRIDVW